MYLLLDANVVAAYYLPRCTDSKNVRSRIEVILDAVRSGSADHFLYIPEFCIAEVFSVFAKNAFGRWNPHLKRRGTIDKRVYRSLVNQFSKDIHNGEFFYQYELTRYHVLGIDMVAPIDHYFQLSRGKARRHVPAGTFDHLLISMALELGHIHGANNVALITADTRVGRIVGKCKGGIPAATMKRLNLHRAQETTGHAFSPSIFPHCLDLVSATKAELQGVFGAWPLTGGAVSGVYRWTRT